MNAKEVISKVNELGIRELFVLGLIEPTFSILVRFYLAMGDKARCLGSDPKKAKLTSETHSAMVQFRSDLKPVAKLYRGAAMKESKGEFSNGKLNVNRKGVGSISAIKFSEKELGTVRMQSVKSLINAKETVFSELVYEYQDKLNRLFVHEKIEGKDVYSFAPYMKSVACEVCKILEGKEGYKSLNSPLGKEHAIASCIATHYRVSLNKPDKVKQAKEEEEKAKASKIESEQDKANRLALVKQKREAAKQAKLESEEKETQAKAIEFAKIAKIAKPSQSRKPKIDTAWKKESETVISA